MEGKEASPTSQPSSVPPNDPTLAENPAAVEDCSGKDSEQQNKTHGSSSMPDSNTASGQKTTTDSANVPPSDDEKTENSSNKTTTAEGGSSGSSADVHGGTGEGDGGCEVQLRVPREHSRLDVLLSQIPKKAQHGLLMQCDLILTCIDANQHYIALGTNIGLTFLYDRQNHTMQRLRSETSSDVISCVKLHDGVDHQLAAGMASGNLCIFFIPGIISASKKQLQKFDVKSMHRHYVTCVEWSNNGMKLFSGDKSGHVVVTEVDFYQGQCKSSELLVESPLTEVVQLDYDHRVLLVSTKHRSFICRLDTTGHTVQIGQKDRKVQGNFGAVLVPGLCKTEDAQLYAVRPGCRIWLSDIHGNVLNTHIFKELLSSSHQEIPLLHPATRTSIINPDLQFGRLHAYSDGQLLTHNTTTLFILHPHRSMVVGSQSQLGGIVDVAVHQDEVFVLRRHGDSAVVRFAYEPEVLFHAGVPLEKPLEGSGGSSKSSSSGTGDNNSVEEEGKEENKAKQFFKKTLWSPFKKLDNFIQEHTQTKEVPPPDLRPVIRSDPDEAAAVPKPPTTQPPPSQDSSPDLPPVVPLDSPDLAVRVFSAGLKGSGSTPVDVQSPDSAHSALSVFAEEVVGGDKGVESSPAKVAQEGEGAEKTDEKGEVQENNDNQDIIFSHQMHKKKAKKKKNKGAKPDKESDSLSQTSLGSQAGEERKGDSAGGHPKEIDDVLRRAEEALSSVDILLKTGENGKEGDSGSASLVGEEQTGEERSKGGEEMPSVSDSARDGKPPADTVSDSSINTQTVVKESRDQETRERSPDVKQDETDLGRSGPEEAKTSLEHNAPVSVPSAVKGGSDHTSKTQPGQNSPRVSPKNTATHAPHVVSPKANKDTSPQSDHPEPQAKTPTSQSSKEKAGSAPSPPKEGEDPLVAAERTLDNMTQRYRLSVKKQESMDDFYSKFSSPYSPTDPLESPPLTPTTRTSSLSSTESDRHAAERQMSSGSWSSDQGVRQGSIQKLSNNWSEFTTPANIYSLALSSSHVWFTDKSENLSYSALGTVKGIVWRKVGEQASQISVSPSGHIVWRLHRGRVFAGTKITHRRPEGLKWVEAVNNVSHISVDDQCAWYVKTTGEVMMQRGLSKERPCFRSLPVETEVGVKQVMARYGVVWAITDSMTLLVRTGISNDTPQGLAWHQVTRHGEPYLFSSVTMDNEGIAWAIDVLGQIWFTDHVTPQNPVGSGKWWQVPLSEYFVQDPGMLGMLRSLAKRWDSQTLSHILNTKRGGLIAAGTQGIWLALDYLNTLYVCRGSLQGYHWSPAQPSQMADSTTWKQVNATIAHLSWGTVWAQQVDGELYAIPADSRDATLTPTPSTFVSYSVNEQSVWGLTGQGELYVRNGMGQHCPLGVDWANLDLLQLGDMLLVHVSCNNNYVWVVDGEGRVFHRIGAGPPRPGQLNPVWLPIDVYTEIIFTKVVIGPLDWMVWAVDNRRLTYVRVGVGEDLPIGKEWIHVPGIQAMDLCVSGAGVWALNTNGEILFRYGITADNVSGNYWKKIPGCFTRISASYEDVLWAVNTTGQLVKCSCRYLMRRQDSEDPLLQRSISTASEEGDWEFV